MTEKDFWIALNIVPGLGKTLFHRLVKFFGSAESVFKAKEKDLRQVEGIGESLSRAILEFNLSRESEKENNYIRNNNAKVFISEEKEYPGNLKNIFDPPPVIYVQGEILERDAAAIAVVGTRSPSHYGKLVAEKISAGLAEKGITVVSGMARGVDSVAHKGAMDAGGRTFAVFGSGLSIVYPPENIRLRNRIIQQGAVISEFPMGRKPDRGNFPARNRIISGLSLGTLVIEAGEKSGALITTQFALDQGRDVFAVPGNINNPKSKGANLLIKKGAKLVEKAEDIIEELPFYIKSSFLKEKAAAREKPALTEEEERLISAIDPEASHIDAIIEKSRIPASRASALLLTLELKGVIKQLAGKMFVVS
ncbi:MAG: DNA-protecting protein DprA [Nitrospinae bacterium]|nr:DNA-protecting protein DprA [Nitrospinota bacterium]